MASVPRGSNKPVSNVNQRFDNLTDNRVKLAAKLKVQSPAVKDILSFMGHEPPFEVQMLDQDGKEKKDERCAVLEIIHARSVSVLPSSQASVERVFSSAKWQIEDRERLAPKLAMKTYIRVNSKALSYQPCCHALAQL